MKNIMKHNHIVYMLVYNNFTNDSRVLKEAVTLSSAGCKVHIIAVLDKGLPQNEKIGDITIHRLENIPLYIKLIGQENFNRLKKIIYKGRMADKEAVGKPVSQCGNSDLTGHRSGTSAGLLKFIFSITKKIFLFHCFYREIEKFFLNEYRINRKIIKTEKNKKDKNKIVHVIHAHDLNTLFIAHKMAKRYKAKLVYDSHELYVQRNRPYSPPGWFLKFEEAFEKKYIRQADAVISVSCSIVDYLKTKYDIPRPFLIMNAPKRCASFNSDNNDVLYGKTRLHSLRNAIGIDNDKKILLYTGGITFGRGLAYVIEALPFLRNFVFVMMGYGSREFKGNLMKIARHFMVDDRVIFYGPVPPGEVTAYAASADIGIAPIENVCLSYYYCAPNKIFEYIQSGLPVIASDFPEMKKIVEENHIGITCDTSNPVNIANSINAIILDYASCFKRVHELKNKFCWENEAEKLKQIYFSFYRPHGRYMAENEGY